ncbi:MAG TPA: endonuclease/exonuclease/phosphatase family protein [Flavobacteriaceae bacterium]|nr:endonuclease/exonuclease/phosphatase family protein [Flavobacteriaceae bacterium]
MKFILRRLFLLLLPVIIGLSCHQNSFNLEKALLRTERILVEVTSVLEDEIILELDESVEESSIPEFKNLSLASWNIQHLGRSKTDEEIWEMAQILRHFDIVAIQEVVAKDPAGAQAVARLVDALNRTGSQWDYRISNPTKSPSVYMSERYAFLWKPSRVAIQYRAFLDKERENLFYREPYIAAFKSKKENKIFYVANYHSRKYNDNPQEEIIHLLDYPERWNTPYLLIAGDFNTSEKDAVWDSFYKKGFKSALNNKKTTLKWKCDGTGYLNHPIDNIYYTSQVELHQANSVDFVVSCENLEHARGISDHLPVYMEFSLR